MSKSFKNAQRVIEKFGGIRPMAAKLNVAVTTVQGWKKRNNIPETRTQDVIDAALSNDINLSDLVVSNSNESETTITPSGTTENAQSNNTSTKISGNKKNKAVPSDEVLEMRRNEFTPIEGEQALAALEQMHRNNMRYTVIGSLAVIISLLSLGIAFFAFDSASSKTDSTMDTRAIRSLEQEIAAYKSRTDRNATALQNTENAVGSLGVRLDAVETRALSTFNETFKDEITDIQNSVTSFQAGLEELQEYSQTTNVTTSDIKALAMLFALSEFRQAFNRLEPFEQDLNVLSAVLNVQQDPELADAIARLTPYARDGVLTVDQLREELGNIASDAVVASLEGRDDVSLQDRFMARFNQIVQITNEEGDLISGTDADQKISTAQEMLKEEKVEEAVSILQTLDPNTREFLAPWFKQAEGTMAAFNFENLLSKKLITTLKTQPANVSGAASENTGLKQPSIIVEDPRVLDPTKTNNTTNAVAP